MSEKIRMQTEKSTYLRHEGDKEHDRHRAEDAHHHPQRGREIAEQHGGTINYYYRNGWNVMEIMLPLAED